MRTSTPPFAHRSPANIDPNLPGGTVFDCQAARTQTPPRVDKPPRARKVVSFNENVHVVTYPYEASSAHSFVTGDVSASRYIEAKQPKRRSHAVFRLLARVTAPLSQHDQSPLPGVVLSPTNCLSAPYDACCGLRIGENDAAYDNQSPLMRSARSSLDRRSIEGGAPSVCSSGDQQDDIDPLVSYECARRTVVELTNQTAIVDERLRRGTVTDDFDYNERPDSDEGDTLSLSDAHPSRDGIDEPEAIGDQLLSPPKEGKSDERESPAFNIVPLWQRLKRVDELDVAGPSKASLIRENAEVSLRQAARDVQVVSGEIMNASLESNKTIVGNGNGGDDDKDQEHVPTEPRGKRPKPTTPIEETEGHMIATAEEVEFSSVGNTDKGTGGSLEEEVANVILPSPCVLDQGSSSDPWSTADPASDLEAMLHSHSSSAVMQSGEVGHENTEMGTVANLREVSVHAEAEDEVVKAVSDESTAKIVNIVIDEIVGDTVKAMAEVEHEGLDGVVSESASNNAVETASGVAGDVSDFTDTSTGEGVLANADVAANEVFDDALAEVIGDMIGDANDTEDEVDDVVIDNNRSDDTEAVNEISGKNVCDVADEAIGNDTGELPGSVTKEAQYELLGKVKGKVRDKDGNDVCHGRNLCSAVPEGRVQHTSEAISSCERERVDSHKEHASTGTPGAVSGEIVQNTHNATPTECDGAGRVSSTPCRYFAEVKPHVPSLDDRKVAKIYEEPCAAGNVSAESQGKIARSADSLLQEACDLEEQLMTVVEDASMKLLREESSEVSIGHANEMSEATITETTTSASARLSARLRGEEPSREAGLGLDLDPLYLSQNDYSIAACTPAMSPLAGVYYGDVSPSRQAENYPERSAAGITGLVDYPEYGMLKCPGMGDSLFESDPNIPIMQAASRCGEPFNELELGVQFRDENTPCRQVIYDDRRPKQAVPEVLLHDWSGIMPVEPSVEIIDSAPNSRSSATGVPSTSPRTIEPQEDFRHAALMLSARLNADMSQPRAHSSSEEEHEPYQSKRDSTKTEVFETTGSITDGSSAAVRKAQNHNLSVCEGSKTKGPSKRHSGSKGSKATKKDFSFSSSLSHSGRQKSPANRRANENEKFFAPTSDAEHGELTDPKLRDFQMGVERKSVSEMGYRTAGLQSRDRSFLEMDRSKEPASDFRTYADSPNKHGLKQHRHLSQQRRGVSNMEMSELAREDGITNPFWNVMEKLVNRMQLGKKGVLPS